ncbi:hypothetical protein V6N11_016459 [Hibiscus sabdariffa]|uniref:Disease resistance protein RGA3 n=1 Tax=Hibiscus sabdariffa TaxID=183260 RepID=A0ABR2TV62_9ROSI
MADGTAFDIARGLVSLLRSSAMEQLALWWNFKDDLEDLKSIVEGINAVLRDAEERSMTNDGVKFWLKKVKDALYDAEDLLDDVDIEANRKDAMSGNKLMKEVHVFFSSSNQFVYGLKMGREIKAIKARFTFIQNLAKELNLKQCDHPVHVETPFMAKKRKETHSFVDEGEIIGREDDKAALLELLLDREFQSEENVIILPIVGFGGLGKTALAQFVYNHERVKGHFKPIMWVTVSNVFDLKTIVANIIQSATKKPLEKDFEMDQLQKKLRNEIDGKKYLLVLDDIWNENGEQWFSLEKLLMSGARGSRIIITTRFHKVAKITRGCEPCFLKGLSDDDAWSLFQKKAFKHRSADLRNPAFLEIGKQISERCSGVPLVINTIASTILSKETENEWRSFKDNILKNCRRILKNWNLTHLPLGGCHSLTHMPSRIGKLTSLESLSMFVVDKLGSHGAAAADLKEFRAANLKEKQHLHSLVLQWSGPPFLDNEDDGDDEEKSLEDLQPHPNLKELSVEGWNGDAKFPRWLSLLTNLVNIEIWGPAKFKHLPSFAQLPHLRMLRIDSLTDLEYMEDSEASGGQGESESFFPSLTSLELFYCPNLKSWWRKRPIDDHNNDDSGTGIPVSTMSFPCLSSLHIQGCPLTSMPLYPSLDDQLTLVNTSSRPLKQTMQMNIAPSTSSLPLSKLKSLEVVYIEELDPDILDECTHNKSLSRCLQQLTSLQSLTISDWKAVDLEGMQWEHLKNLSHLEFDDIPGLEYMEDSEPSGGQGESESFFPSLTSLKLIKCPNLKSWWRKRPTDDHNMDDNGIEIQTSTMAFPCLSNLGIEDCPLTSMPLYPSLDELTLINTSSRPLKQTIQMSISASTSSLPLSKLKIRDCKEVDLEGMQWEPLKNLSHLEFHNIPHLEFLPLSFQHLTNLKELHLNNLPNLASVPDEMRCLTTLQVFKMNQMPQLEERCEKGIGADWHKIAHIPEIEVNGVVMVFHALVWSFEMVYFKSYNVLEVASSREVQRRMSSSASSSDFNILHSGEFKIASGRDVLLNHFATVKYRRNFPVRGEMVPIGIRLLTSHSFWWMRDADRPKKLVIVIFWIAYFDV